MIVFLMGLRGAGKSTVGRLVAARLGWAFVDLDDETARGMGFASASAGLRARGVEAFRRAEVDALASLIARPFTGPGLCIALGGGTPTAPGAADLLRGTRSARAVYLRAGAGELQNRLRHDAASRPSLTGADPVEEVPAVLAQRDELYRTVADVVIETDGLSPNEVAELVLLAVR